MAAGLRYRRRTRGRWNWLSGRALALCRRVFPMPGIFSELRAAGMDATLRFLRRQVRLGEPGPWCLAKVPVQLTLLEV